MAVAFPRPRLAFLRSLRGLGVLLLVHLVTGTGGKAFAGSGSNQLSGRADRGYGYRHDVDREVPWSINVFWADRTRRDLVWAIAPGGSNRLGMSTVTEQIKALPSALGKPLAAVNGDFYVDDSEVEGDPRDLQIHQGELMSIPKGHACFWIDSDGNPHSTNVVSRCRVVWPDGSSLPFGLNEHRENEAAVLYTAAVGSKTPTTGGTELILEAVDQAWLPLSTGRTLHARVRSVQKSGGIPLDRKSLVLSLGPKLESKASVGTVIQIVTETFPDLGGSQAAIGGGPTLVRNGKAMEWSGFLLRHPRTAVGWNKDRFFLVQVDGRQMGLSVGMTLPELATYMIQLGCDQAMNLDGGGSSTMWVFGQVMNSPSEGQERPGANSLVLLLKKSEAGGQTSP